VSANVERGVVIEGGGADREARQRRKWTGEVRRTAVSRVRAIQFGQVQAGTCYPIHLIFDDGFKIVSVVSFAEKEDVGGGIVGFMQSLRVKGYPGSCGSG